MKYLLRWLLLVLFFVTFFAQSAWAYLDPGSGSFIIQIIVAIFVGGFTVLKNFRMAVLNVIRKIFAKRKKD